MTKSPLVSVIIPAFNGERYLAEAIASIRAQPIGPLELVIVDDGSTDRTAAVVRKVAPDAKYVLQANQGPGAARNTGVRIASGSYLAFIDADDIWMPDKLRRQLNALEQDPKHDIVTGLVQQFRSPELDPAVSARLVCPDQPMPGFVFGATLMRRATFDLVGPLSVDLALGESLDWFARARSLGLQIKQLGTVVLRRRLHTTNISVSQRHARTDYVRAMKTALDRRRAEHQLPQPFRREAG